MHWWASEKGVAHLPAWAWRVFPDHATTELKGLARCKDISGGRGKARVMTEVGGSLGEPRGKCEGAEALKGPTWRALAVRLRSLYNLT